MKRAVLAAVAVTAGLILAAAVVAAVHIAMVQAQTIRDCVVSSPSGCAVSATINTQTGACQLAGPQAPAPGTLTYEVDCTLGRGHV